MPIDLVLVRHGQSEQNLASHHAKKGDSSFYNDSFRARHDSQHRLTPRGREQAKQAGQWLKQNEIGYFDRRYVSAYVRAKETAGILNTDGPNWIVEPLLREREWGDFANLPPEERQALSADSVEKRDTDPFYWIPPNGESIAQVTNRLRPILNTLHRECSDKRVVIVCHGEVMRAFRFVLERMSVEGWVALENSKRPGDDIYNCQILHYSRRNPETGELADHLDWKRSISPADPSNDGPGWEVVKRHRFSNQELLAQVKAVEHIFPDHPGY